MDTYTIKNGVGFIGRMWSRNCAASDLMMLYWFAAGTMFWVNDIGEAVNVIGQRREAGYTPGREI